MLRQAVRTVISVAVLAGAGAAQAALSPGIEVGLTFWDEQHSQGQAYQLAKSSAERIVHFSYAFLDIIPINADVGPFMIAYNGFNLNTQVLVCGFIGCQGCLDCDFGTNIGGPSVAVTRDNLFHSVYHLSPEAGFPETPWHQFYPLEGSSLHLDYDLSPVPYDSSALDPRIDVQHNDPANGQTGADVVHVVAHQPFASNDRNLLFYWRHDGTVWSPPAVIDSTSTASYLLAADAYSDRVALVLHPDDVAWATDSVRNIAYRVSQTEGVGWLDGSELGFGTRTPITAYVNPLGPEAGISIASAYDHEGILHVLWDERRSAGSAQASIRHWDNATGMTSVVTSAYWNNPRPNGGEDLNLAKITLGIGDGSTVCDAMSPGQTNRNYLYALYTRFGGPTPAEQADYSRGGYMNGELYLSVSPDGGHTWWGAENITNTKTPDCIPDHPDSICASEHWGSIARTVDDIHIFYISDQDAGAAPRGEGTWTPNRTMYLNLPGGGVDAPYLCPDCLCPCYANPVCDGVLNVLDVVLTVKCAWADLGGCKGVGTSCPVYSDTDVDCDGFTNVLDVVKLVEVVFRSGDPGWYFCDPCAQ